VAESLHHGLTREESARLLEALRGGAWELVEKVLNDRRGGLVRQLVQKDSEEVRGRIKELDQLFLLPQTLIDVVTAALPGTGAA